MENENKAVTVTNAAPAAAPAPAPAPVKEEAENKIKGGKYQGKELGARAWAEKTKELTGKVLCPSHMKVYADG